MCTVLSIIRVFELYRQFMENYVCPSGPCRIYAAASFCLISPILYIAIVLSDPIDFSGFI
jgi:hypothetical protein